MKYNSNGGSTGIWNWEGSLDQVPQHHVIYIFDILFMYLVCCLSL